MAQTLEAIKYDNGELYVLNQLLLPHVTHFDKVSTIQDGHAAIKEMKTRGAPAIAIVAALSLAVDLQSRSKQGEFDTPASAVEFVRTSLEYLKTSRPTAVNLFDAAGKLWRIVEQRAQTATTPLDIVNTYVSAAVTMLAEDVNDNKNIGAHGAKFILENSKNSHVSVLTHCNTGYAYSIS
jgi:methylthioribose-1-phosphate isomerase